MHSSLVRISRGPSVMPLVGCHRAQDNPPLWTLNNPALDGGMRLSINHIHFLRQSVREERVLPKEILGTRPTVAGRSRSRRSRSSALCSSTSGRSAKSCARSCLEPIRGRNRGAFFWGCIGSMSYNGRRPWDTVCGQSTKCSRPAGIEGATTS